MTSSTTETDIGVAASALFTLHSSPLVRPVDLPRNFLAFPSLSLSGGVSETKTASTFIPGRPRAATWDSSMSELPAYSLSQLESDADAAGTLCALMQSHSPIIRGGTRATRPRSQSTSVTLPSMDSKPKGLRPRSVSVTSNSSFSKRPARPRSSSVSSKVGQKGSRKRAISMDSTTSYGMFEDEEYDDDDDLGEEDDEIISSRIELEDLRRIGKYSPESRRKRIERFLEKRRRRIWRKRIKYDVRKNFADSRLRVKGRFVRKEDEEQLREYLQMT